MTAPNDSASPSGEAKPEAISAPTSNAAFSEPSDSGAPAPSAQDAPESQSIKGWARAPAASADEISSILLGVAPAASPQADKVEAALSAGFTDDAEPAKRPRGRPRKDGSQAQPGERVKRDPIDAGIDKKELAVFDTQAQFYSSLWFGAFSAIDPIEAKPSALEEKAMHGAVRAVLIKHNIADIPPMMSLAIVMVSYTLARAMKPKTRGFFGKCFDTIKGWF